MLKKLLLACLALCVLASPQLSAATTTPKERGLLITPLRQYENVDAGSTVTRSFTIGNLTNKPMEVATSVETFSVVDLTYDFRFSTVKNEYIQLPPSPVVLKPFESKQLAYKISIPTGAAAGGQYFTLLASAKLSNNSVQETVRAASLLYLTVNGDLRKTGVITESGVPPLVFTTTIPYHMTIKNTGNVHYFAYVSARVDGLFYAKAPTGTSVLLMPDTSRQIKASVPSPLLPGIYKVTYGYKPDAGPAVTRTSYVLFTPPWFIAALAIIGLVIWKKRQSRPKTRASTDS